MATIYGTLNSELIHEAQGVTDDADTIFALAGDDDIYGLGGNDEILAGQGADTVFGGNGDDTIDGAEHNDFIEGGAGADAIDGGSGIDIALYTNSAFAVTVNLATGQGQGSEAEGDTFANVENVTGSAYADTLTGNDSNNSLLGNTGNDTLLGGLGTDLLWGGDGQDTASYSDSASGVMVDLVTGAGSGGTAANDTLAEIEHLSGSQHGDSLFGNGGVNVLNGQAGDDFLVGNGGADTLMGSAGTDTLKGGGGADVLNGGLDLDTATYSDSGAGVVVSLATNIGAYGDAEGDVLTSIENLTGSAHPDSLFGDNGANVLSGLDGYDTIQGGIGNDTLDGGAGNDTLDGGAAADILQGGLGNDWFYVDTMGDQLIENAGQGSDRALALVSYTLGAGQAIETLTTTNNFGLAAINLAGNELANTIYGNAGANTLNGHGGADLLVGLGGNDWFFVDNAGDIVIEAAGEGGDQVFASVDYTLGAGAFVEVLSTTSTPGLANLNLTGNELVNTVMGNAGSNAIKGLGGNDVLYGGGGVDAFVFNTALNAATNVDTILDLSVADDDLVLASWIFTALTPGTLSAGAFAIGAAATEADDRIIYNNANGLVYYDADGVGGAAQTLFASVGAGLGVTNADFIVV